MPSEQLSRIQVSKESFYGDIGINDIGGEDKVFRHT